MLQRNTFCVCVDTVRVPHIDTYKLYSFWFIADVDAIGFFSLFFIIIFFLLDTSENHISLFTIFNRNVEYDNYEKTNYIECQHIFTHIIKLK